jgi:glycosyltransferase involved in cell wall biosynthesis
MAAGLPAVASPVGVNARLLDGGRGFLASDRDAWGAALTRLRDGALRREQGAAARRFVEREYSVTTWFPHLLDIVESVRLGERPNGTAIRTLENAD